MPRNMMTWVLAVGLLASGALAEEPDKLELISNGNFASLDAQSRPNGWAFRSGELKGQVDWGARRDDALKANYLFIKTESLADAHCWAFQDFDVEPGRTYELRFKAKGWASKDVDHGVSCGFEFKDGGGKYISYFNACEVCAINKKFHKKVDDVKAWKDFSGVVVAPLGIKKMRLRLDFAVNGGECEADFADVSVTTRRRGVGEVLAKEPERLPLFKVGLKPVASHGVTLTPEWNLDDAATWISATRAKYCLNGLWAAQPAALSTAPQAGDWAFVKIAGRLASPSGGFNYGVDRCSWRKGGLSSSPCVWLLRDLAIPPEPAGDVSLFISGLGDAAARVYWNGEPQGILTNMWGGEVALPGAKPGERGQLAIVLLKTPQESYAFLMEDGIMKRAFDGTRTTGAIDVRDIFLNVRPHGFSANEPWLIPSTRTRTLTVETPASPNAESVSLDIAGMDGKIVCEGKRLPAEKIGGKLRAVMPWPDARTWSPDDPYLHVCKVSTLDKNGTVLDGALPVRFGFREVWTDGKLLMMNGQPLRLRTRMTNIYSPVFDDASIRRSFAFLKDMGFSCMLRPPTMDNVVERDFVDAYYRIADEMGMMIIAYVPIFSVSGGQFGEDEMDVKDGRSWLRYVEKNLVDRLRNHPSVIAYGGFGNSYGEGFNPLIVRPDLWGVKPLRLDGTLLEHVKDPKKREGYARLSKNTSEAIRKVKALDVTKPFLSHADGGEGDGWGIMDYFNWTPTQEWQDWIETWAREGVMPIGSGEHGLPYHTSFVNHGIPGGTLEPWLSEYAAMIFGPAVYQAERPRYLEQIKTSFHPERGDYGDGKRAAEHRAGKAFCDDNPELVEPVLIHKAKNIYRAWRAYGLPMGADPFGSESAYVKREELRRGDGAVMPPVTAAALKRPGAQADQWTQIGAWPNPSMPSLPERPSGRCPEVVNEFGKELREVSVPLLVYIGGPAERFTTKDHVFVPGETVEKSIVCVWDGFAPKPLKLTWRLVANGKVLSSHDLEVTLAGGEIKKIPFKFAAPGADAEIVLNVADAKSGETLTRDVLALQSLADAKAPDSLKNLKIAVLDPSGESEAPFKRLGLATTRLSSLSELKDADILVIGRKCLPLLENAELDAIPSKTQILVLEQLGKDLEKIGFRTFPVRHRQAFQVVGQPMTGVSDAMLSDWRVEPKLLPEGCDPLRDGYNYHTNYRGTLCSVSIETPTRGAFTPLLVDGFDLRETPLLEAVMDGRRWIFCQLSVVDPLPDDVTRGDPVAKNILVQTLERLAKKPTAPRLWAFAGDATESALLEELGTKPSSFSSFDSIDVLVLGRGAKIDAKALAAWVEKGGTVIALPQPDGFYADAIPNVKTRTLKSSLPAYAHSAAFQGLSPADFHYRQPLDLRGFGDQLEVAAQVDAGQGKWILLGFDPSRLDVEAAPYLRLSKRHQLRALAQILNNCGVPAQAPMKSMLAKIPAPYFNLDMYQLGGARMAEWKPELKDWINPGFDDSAWAPVGLSSKCLAYGNAALRIKFDVAGKIPTLPLTADMGTFDDFDEVYLNGVLIGSTTPANHDPETAWEVRRLYSIPAGPLKEGANVLAIHAWNRNTVTKGWKTWVRGPLELGVKKQGEGLYSGTYQHSDDPYLQRHW